MSKYIKDLDNYLKRDKLKLNKQEQQEILKAYNRAFDSMLKQYKANSHKKNATQIARTVYCKQLQDEISSIIKEYNMKVTDNILNSHVNLLNKYIKYYGNTDLYKQLEEK